MARKEGRTRQRKAGAGKKAHAERAQALVDGLPAAKRRGVKLDVRPSATRIIADGRRVATVRQSGIAWVRVPEEQVGDVLAAALNGSHS